MMQITWMLGLLPDWFWTVVLIAGVLGILASWVLKFVPFVSTYRLPIQVGSILALLVGVYFQGVIANEAKWQNEIAALQEKVNEAAVKSNETNVVVQEKVVTKTKVIKEKGQDIIKYVDREIVKKEEIIKYIEMCPVPKEIIDLHNQAAELNKAAEGKK
jgi:low affinity Fe/Cu permease